ncbi:MAG: hypothetical protein OEW08_04205, partial [Gammaproteobacteria bacterium]|nr:hypothetical protein [Gammaproteobacteria bacterium]
MDTEVTVAIVTGIFLTISTVFSGITAYLTKRTTNTFDRKSEDLKESFEKTSRLIITDGERETVAKLIQLTLEEEAIVRVTRFNPRKIQRRERYYQAMQARIAGSIFEGDHYKRLEKYCRLTSFNSRENKESLIEMINEFKGGKCKNLILRVTSDKNDYEILIFEKSKVAALCFHDVMNQDVVHSCMIVREGRLFDNF